MEGSYENQLRLLTLYKHMGDLWAVDDITELNNHIQEGDPAVPEHCYEFKSCLFWVHLIGLPRAAMSEPCISKIA